MKKNRTKRPQYRLLKAGCVGAGLLSISNPTQVTAADIGVLDVHNFSAPPVSLGTVSNPFPQSPMGVHVAAGDLNGDGFADIVMSPGRGATQFAAVSGEGAKHPRFFDVDTLPSGAGVRVATGDIDGDGKADIIATPSVGPTSSAQYIKIQDVPGDEKVVLDTFDNIFDGFSGGVSVATANLDGSDLTPPTVLAAKVGSGCKNCGWDLATNKKVFAAFDAPASLPKIEGSPSGVGGLNIAAGDIDGDGFDEILALPTKLQGGGVMGPLLQKGKEKWIEIQGWDWEVEAEGVHIAMGDLDGDGNAELVAGSSRGVIPHIKWYSISSIPGTTGFMADHKGEIEILSFGAGFRGGVNVAVGDVNGDGFGDIVYAPGAIPEPATILSLLTGFGTWLFAGRRRKRSTSPV